MLSQQMELACQPQEGMSLNHLPLPACGQTGVIILYHARFIRLYFYFYDTVLW
jgi:hypothetical protein